MEEVNETIDSGRRAVLHQLAGLGDPIAEHRLVRGVSSPQRPIAAQSIVNPFGHFGVIGMSPTLRQAFGYHGRRPSAFQTTFPAMVGSLAGRSLWGLQTGSVRPPATPSRLAIANSPANPATTTTNHETTRDLRAPVVPSQGTSGGPDTRETIAYRPAAVTPVRTPSRTEISRFLGGRRHSPGSPLGVEMAPMTGGSGAHQGRGSSTAMNDPSTSYDDGPADDIGNEEDEAEFW
jgi:hypothetical protein